VYDLNDTITAPASPVPGENNIARSVIRISGQKAFTLLDNLFGIKINKRCTKTKTVQLQKNICIELTAYGFLGPNSYTGEDLVELHFFAPACITELVLKKLLENSRLAEPGEFTLRAYLSGRIDLAQAEAVAQIVSSSNTAQLAAAEKLLAGRLSEKIALIRTNILDILSLIEAGLDFSGEDIEFISQKNAAQTIEKIKKQLIDILTSSIRYEEMIDLPSVGLAGAPNAGKSSLLNTLLGRQRSIVSNTQATTRDVLTGVLTLEKNRIALFDCAGLSAAPVKASLLDTLAQQAAAEALKNADIVLFCIDITKHNFSEDLALLNLVNSENIIYVAAKCDLDDQYQKNMDRLNDYFGAEFIPVSSVDLTGIEQLKIAIDDHILQLKHASSQADEFIAINQRHRSAVENAITNLDEALAELELKNEEVVSMLLRSAYQTIGALEREDIDQKVLERIFSSFCIGK